MYIRIKEVHGERWRGEWGRGEGGEWGMVGVLGESSGRSIELYLV